MIWRSVVGKLWITIIGLVTLVLLSLSLFLTQFFDRFYYQMESKSILNLAHAAKEVLQNSGDQKSALLSISGLVEGENRKLMIISLSESKDAPSPVKEMLMDSRLNPVWQGEEVTIRGNYPVNRNGKINLEDTLFVAIPFNHEEEQKIILIYESLFAVTKTTEGTKNLILYAAGFAIVLTTIFAFFLSTRITKPLLQLRNAADKLAKGNFKSRVNIRSSDEIGALGATFNRMAEQLDESIHMISHEKEKLASILRSMADGVISVDLNMEIKITNPLADKFLFYWQYDVPELPPPLIAMFRECIEQNREIARDIEIKGAVFAAVTSPLYDREKISGAVAVFRDVTNERNMDKLRKDFVANVSHELRTPIAMLQGYSEAILDGVAATDEERNELISIIYDESVRMGKLVNELLDLARMEAGHLQLNPAEIQLNQLITKIKRKYTAIVKERNISLNFNLLAGDDRVFLDEDRFEQVLINLIDNAIRHTADEGEVNVSFSRNEKALQVEVSDNGSGIAPEDLPHLFERFYKGDKARTRGRSGTGLGLSIVKNIVDAHRGHIYVDSEVGKGTKFVISFPQNDEFK